MKFLIDAQLPKLLAQYLRDQGLDAIHTLELPDRNRTSDSQIRAFSLAEQRVVITKDSDFYDSFKQKQEPFKLIYLTVGNLSNQQLVHLFEKNLPHILKLMQLSHVVEMNQHFIITLL
jgi:predicted nuclease of predicted toxin-antitoxin system